MTGTQLNGVGRTCQVLCIVAAATALALLTQSVDALQSGLLQFVDFHAHRLLLVGSDITEIGHQRRYLTLLAQVFQTQGFYLLRIRCGKPIHFFEQLLNLLKYHSS